MSKDKMVSLKKKNARILFVLDRSGSMRSIAEETIGGFNSFVEGQKAVPGKATFSLVQFDNVYEVVHNNIPLEEVPELTKEVFVPRGMTALYDAVGMTIEKFKNDNPKNTKTIVAILTDGEENSSKEYSYSSVRSLIEEVESKHGWEVMFIGANMNAQHVAATMGIKSKNSTSFDYDGLGIGAAMGTICSATSAMRGMNQSYADGSTLDANNIDMTKLYNDVKLDGNKMNSNA